MRYVIALVALAAALAAPAAAPGGGWATVQLEALPTDIDAGGTWNARLTVLRHGETPTDGAEPMITISSEKGEAETFAAKPAGEPGVYEAAVVFPTAGTWSYEISDGLAATGYGVDTTTTYPPLTVGAGAGGVGDGSLPALPLAGFGLVLALAGAAAAVVMLRRSRRLTPAGR
jgi:YtkA-like